MLLKQVSVVLILFEYCQGCTGRKKKKILKYNFNIFNTKFINLTYFYC